MTDEIYEVKWSTPIGKDCINLDVSLSEWLGTRMIHLSKHSNSYPIGFDNPEDYNRELNMHGVALLEYVKDNSNYTTDGHLIASKAKDAMHWVANNLETLWD